MLQLNDTIKLGIYSSSDGAPIPLEWTVCKIHGNLAQVAIKDVSLIQHPYSSLQVSYDLAGKSDSRWRDSELRKWLNEDVFESSFSSTEKQCIVETIINDDQEWEVKLDRGYEGEKEISFTGKVNKISTLTTRDRLFIPKLEDIMYYKRYEDNGFYSVTDTYLNVVKGWERKLSFRYFTVLNICRIKDTFMRYDFGSHIGIRYDSYDYCIDEYQNHIELETALWRERPVDVLIPVMMWIDLNKYVIS